MFKREILTLEQLINLFSQLDFQKRQEYKVVYSDKDSNSGIIGVGFEANENVAILQFSHFIQPTSVEQLLQKLAPLRHECGNDCIAVSQSVGSEHLKYVDSIVIFCDTKQVNFILRSKKPSRTIEFLKKLKRKLTGLISNRVK